MGFKYDFASGIVLCGECGSNIKTHFDKAGLTKNILNKECFKNTKCFLKSWLIVPQTREYSK